MPDSPLQLFSCIPISHLRFTPAASPVVWRQLCKDITVRLSSLDTLPNTAQGVRWVMPSRDATDDFLNRSQIICEISDNTLTQMINTSLQGLCTPQSFETTLAISEFGYSTLQITTHVSAERDQIISILEAYQATLADWFDGFGRMYVHDTDDTLISAVREIDTALTVALLAEGYQCNTKSDAYPSPISTLKSYVDALIFSGSEDSEIYDDMIVRIGGNQVCGSGDMYFKDLRWSVGFTVNVYYAPDENSQELCKRVTSRAMLAWAMLEHCSTHLQSYLKSTVSQHLTARQDARRAMFWRKVSRIIVLDTAPTSAANWSTDIDLYTDIWRLWRIDELAKAATEGNDAIAEILKEEAALRQSEFERRINDFILIISSLALIGLVMQLVDFIYSADPPESSLRMTYLLSAILVTVAIILSAWLAKRSR